MGTRPALLGPLLGICLLLALGVSASAQETTIECESKGSRYSYCKADTRGYVRLVRQLSDAPCRKDWSWGYDAWGIWVDRGCDGQFAYGRTSGGGNAAGAVPPAGLGAVAQGVNISTPRDDATDDVAGSSELRRAYELGRKRGKEDFRASSSRNYKRHDDEYKRRTESSFRRGYEEAYDDLAQANGGMTPVQRVHYDDGFRHGRADWSAGRSRNYKRYRWEYDSRSERYFRQGYEDGYSRQPRAR